MIVPSPLSFSPDTRCYGESYWIQGEIECSFNLNRTIAYLNIETASIGFGNRILREIDGR